jgi:hypothetical protein
MWIAPLNAIAKREAHAMAADMNWRVHSQPVQHTSSSSVQTWSTLESLVCYDTWSATTLGLLRSITLAKASAGWWQDQREDKQIEYPHMMQSACLSRPIKRFIISCHTAAQTPINLSQYRHVHFAYARTTTVAYMHAFIIGWK